MAPNYNRNYQDQAPREFEEKIVQVNRTSKKTTGGNTIGFSVLVVVGDKKGRVGVGLGKAGDVSSAVQKATNYAKRHFINVPITNGTIPHEVYLKWGAGRVLLKPAKEGTGIIAGGAVRAVVETAGVTNIVSKMLGTSNKATNVYTTIEALKSLQQGKRHNGSSTDNKAVEKVKEKSKSKKQNAK